MQLGAGSSGGLRKFSGGMPLSDEKIVMQQNKSCKPNPAAWKVVGLLSSIPATCESAQRRMLDVQ